MPLKIRIGSRPSKLALAQASIVSARLSAIDPDIEIEVVEIRTSGDHLTTASLAQVGGKGLFIKELEHALTDGAIDIALHSMKDLPAVLPVEFKLAAVPERENSADILVTRDGSDLMQLPAGARLGTSSSRRRFQALKVNRAIEVTALRGNVDTRLRRVADGALDAIIIALAGLKRLGRTGDVKFVELSSEQFVAAGGQGALALEMSVERRPGAAWIAVERALSALNDARAYYETAAERSFLAAIGASCTTPLGVKASLIDANLAMRAMLFSQDGSREIDESIEEPQDPGLAPSIAEGAGKRLAEKMLERGAGALLDEMRSHGDWPSAPR